MEVVKVEKRETVYTLRFTERELLELIFSCGATTPSDVESLASTHGFRLDNDNFDSHKFYDDLLEFIKNNKQ